MARRLRRPEGQLDLFGEPAASPGLDIRDNLGFGPDTAELERNASGQPLSPETGGCLSAAEVERLLAGRSLRVIGYRFQRAGVLCRACARAEVPGGGYPPSMAADQTAGFMTSIYSDERGVREKCLRCGGPVRSDI